MEGQPALSAWHFGSVALASVVSVVVLWIASSQGPQSVSRELTGLHGHPAAVPPVALSNGGLVFAETEALSFLSPSGDGESISLAPAGVNIASGRKPVALSAKFLNSVLWTIVLSEKWNVLAFRGESLELAWERTLATEERAQLVDAPVEPAVVLTEELGGLVVLSGKAGNDQEVQYFSALSLHSGNFLWTTESSRLHASAEEHRRSLNETIQENQFRWIRTDSATTTDEKLSMGYRLFLVRQLPHIWREPADTGLEVVRLPEQPSSGANVSDRHGSLAVLSRSSEGLELIELETGRTLDVMALEPFMGHADFTADGILEALVIVPDESSRERVEFYSEISLLYLVSQPKGVSRRPKLRAIVLFDHILHCLDVIQGKTIWSVVLPNEVESTESASRRSGLEGRLVSVEALRDGLGQVKFLAVVGGGEVDFIDVSNGKTLSSSSHMSGATTRAVPVDSNRDGSDDGLIVRFGSTLHLVTLSSSTSPQNSDVALFATGAVAIFSIAFASLLWNRPASKLRSH